MHIKPPLRFFTHPIILNTKEPSKHTFLLYFPLLSPMRVSKKMTDSCSEQELDELRRGPWTLDEDNLLIHYITCHGEGRWNSLAKSSGLKRTGKSCRLRWLNYLKPDVKHGNLTPQEQLLILELHSKWGNRWSKIAQHLPGRTDNEIKNYWRTKVQKQARHLKIDSNSKRFVEALRQFWLPRLFEKVDHTSPSSSTSTSTMEVDQKNLIPQPQGMMENMNSSSSNSESSGFKLPYVYETSLHSHSYNVDNNNFDKISLNQPDVQELGSSDMSILDFQLTDAEWISNDTFWNMDQLW
ncbi:unnamed protein product [Lactuca saligna]|uniref:Uncharacterized protein n=1 Tax=Lactuca saligna TaxID=75948 RepID=A0AA35ZQ25_LACSI|nr:unnamed protein product [Lactuca saligna]